MKKDWIQQDEISGVGSQGVACSRMGLESLPVQSQRHHVPEPGHSWLGSGLFESNLFLSPYDFILSIRCRKSTCPGTNQPTVTFVSPFPSSRKETGLFFAALGFV